MEGPGTPASVGSSINRARELTGELRRLQEHVESLDASQLQENVLKVGFGIRFLEEGSDDCNACYELSQLISCWIAVQIDWIFPTCSDRYNFAAERSGSTYHGEATRNVEQIDGCGIWLLTICGQRKTCCYWSEQQHTATWKD